MKLHLVDTSPSGAQQRAQQRSANRYALSATLAMVALILLGISSELFLTPLRPGGSLLVLKIIPLLFSQKGLLKRDNYTMQWTSMLILLYFTEGIVRATSDHLPLAIWLGWLEVALTLIIFTACLGYLRPLKKAAKLATKLATEVPSDSAKKKTSQATAEPH